MNIQAQILELFLGIRNEFFTTFFTSITILAEKTFMVVIISILYWCVDKHKSTRLAWFVLLSTVGNGIVKNIVKMPRPYEVGIGKPLRVETATSFSFPSGHVQSATSFWMGSMIILRTKACKVLGCVIIFLTALSRLYLGVHWPMDVLGAIGFGAIVTYFANQFINEKGEINRGHVLGASLMCLVALIFSVDRDFSNAAASLWGLCLGGYVEQKYVQFELSQKLSKNVARIILGMSGVIIIYVGLSNLLPDIKSLGMIKNALILLWIIVGAPYLFTKLIK